MAFSSSRSHVIVWLRRSNRRSGQSPPPLPVAVPNAASLPTAIAPQRVSVEQAFANAPHWPQLVELMHDNENLLRDVLSLLVRESPRLGRSFQAGLKEKNFSEARRAVHTLKSNCTLRRPKRDRTLRPVARTLQRVTNKAACSTTTQKTCVCWLTLLPIGPNNSSKAIEQLLNFN